MDLMHSLPDQVPDWYFLHLENLIEHDYHWQDLMMENQLYPETNQNKVNEYSTRLAEDLTCSLKAPSES